MQRKGQSPGLVTKLAPIIGCGRGREYVDVPAKLAVAARKAVRRSILAEAGFRGKNIATCLAESPGLKADVGTTGSGPGSGL